MKTCSKEWTVPYLYYFLNLGAIFKVGLEDNVLQQFLYEMNTSHVEHFYEFYKVFLDEVPLY